MTQQSLITRLKAVEEALGDLIELANTAMLQASNGGAEYNRTEELRDANAALSDLRKLIKEAEGQQEVGLLGIVYAPTNKPLYTALGEKP